MDDDVRLLAFLILCKAEFRAFSEIHGELWADLTDPEDVVE